MKTNQSVIDFMKSFTMSFIIIMLLLILVDIVYKDFSKILLYFISLVWSISFLYLTICREEDEEKFSQAVKEATYKNYKNKKENQQRIQDLTEYYKNKFEVKGDNDYFQMSWRELKKIIKQLTNT